MTKEEILNTKPENLKPEACKIFGSDAALKQEYEKKWNTEIECQ